MKVILVTGATSGFGKLIAEGLTTKGHKVYGTRLPDFKESDVNIGFPLLELDVTSDVSVEHCVAELIKREGRVDVLINNAGVSIAGAIEDTEVDEARWQMEVNFFGPLRMIHAVLPHMRTKNEGRILTMGSIGGHIGLPYQGIYSAAKFGLEAINEALRLELRGSGIDSAVVCPGDFKTGLTGARVYTKNARSSHNAQQMAITMGIAEHEEQNSLDPSMVADIYVQLVDKSSLNVRYIVASAMQRFSLVVKRLLPANMFESIIAKSYKIP